MYKVAFFEKEDECGERIPVKVMVRKEDNKEQIEHKSNLALIGLLEDEYEAVDYYLVEIKDLED